MMMKENNNLKLKQIIGLVNNLLINNENLTHKQYSALQHIKTKTTILLES